MRIDAERAMCAFQQRRAPLHKVKSGSPDQRAVAKNPEIAMMIVHAHVLAQNLPRNQGPIRAIADKDR
jgi:hypothetical protein